MELLKCRCSQIEKLMHEPRKKADKEAGLLAETSKTYIKELWLEKNWNYKEIIMTDAMYKGLACEQDSINLVQEFLGGKFRIKNDKHFSNDFITGTPDVIINNFVEDVKTSANARTFLNAELSKNYYYQGQGYLELTGKTKYRLIYCLVNTPDDIVEKEIRRWLYFFDNNEQNKDFIKIKEQIYINNNYDNIPVEDKIKVFEFEKNDLIIEKIYEQIEKARKYYKTL